MEERTLQTSPGRGRVESKNDAMRRYSGMAVNTADGGAVSDRMVKERTKALNNNPRNDR